MSELRKYWVSSFFPQTIRMFPIFVWTRYEQLAACQVTSRHRARERAKWGERTLSFFTSHSCPRGSFLRKLVHSLHLTSSSLVPFHSLSLTTERECRRLRLWSGARTRGDAAARLPAAARAAPVWTIHIAALFCFAISRRLFHSYQFHSLQNSHSELF